MSSYFGTLNYCSSTIGKCPPPNAEGKVSSARPACTLTGGSCASSVLLSAGAFSFRLNLLSISAINGVSWSFGLNYLAGNGIGDILGLGFNYTQNLRLVQITGGAQLASGDNTLDTFIANEDGSYSPDEYNCTQAELVYGVVAGQFTLYASDGTVSQFAGFSSATPGRLLSVTDRFGNTQSYIWQPVAGTTISQLLSVTDSYGRTINYSYHGPEFNYCLAQITDFLGRQLNFQYDGLGHLVAVVTPSVNQAATGNTFPGGMAYVFQYDVNNPRPQRQSDLVKIFFPNEATPFVDAATRTVDVAAVYASATPRYVVTYGQDPTDVDTWGLVTEETVGDPANGVGGTYQYQYNSDPDVTNIIADDPIVFECTVTDRNGNQVVYDFNMAQMPVRVEVLRNRGKINIPSTSDFASYVTWTAYNDQNQPTERVMPEGNTIKWTYENGSVTDISGTYNRRVGLLLSRTELPGNSYSLPNPNDRAGSSGQIELTELFFHDPIYNQLCAKIERRGNPINVSGETNVYFTPQNLGTTPTDSDRSRYATITYYDYQKNALDTITGSTAVTSTVLQKLLFPGDSISEAATNIGYLISFVSGQMSATDGTGGIPAGFVVDLGDINGDGTGDGASSDLPAAAMLGSVVKIQHPSVVQFASSPPSEYREEVFTSNLKGQTTTHTDPNGNLKIFVRYPYNDPEGNGGILVPEPTIEPDVGGKQYGRVKEIHVDANPNDVLSLVGSDGDLSDFISPPPTDSNIVRPTSEPPPLDLVTRFEGGSGASGSGCASCAYDLLGNPLAQTDPRGFTVRFDRNELGEVYRAIAPQPYNFPVETYYDANRNVVRVDTEDWKPAYDSSDPTSARFAQFTPSGSGYTAHVAMRPGPGGSVRPGWFTNLFAFDLLDNKTQDDIDATGSTPANLITNYLRDPNENIVAIIKPQGNMVEFDYDERNLRIAIRIGAYLPSPVLGRGAGGEGGAGEGLGDVTVPSYAAVIVIAHDGNGNLLQVISPLTNGSSSGNQTSVTINDAFRSGSPLDYTGEFALENTYDGFDRVIQAMDAVGGYVDTGIGYTEDTGPFLDPDGRVILANSYGTTGGETPTDRTPATTMLATAIARFDEGGRQYETQREVFFAGPDLDSGRAVTQTGGGLAYNSTANDNTGTINLATDGSPSGDMSYVLMRNIFDPGGRIITRLGDLVVGSTPSQTNFTFDGADRPITVTDALGNSLANTFDANGNLVSVLRTEYCTISDSITAETFSSAAYYDCLNQMVLSAAQGADGNLNPNVMGLAASISFWDMAPWNVASSTLISCRAFDSRRNPVLSIDPKGNSSVTVFDGASRAIQTQQHLRWAGQGQNPPAWNQTLLPASAGAIVTTLILDGNGRTLQLIDDRGAVTRFEYDTLDRETLMIFQDGSTRMFAYDQANDVVTYTDENTNVFTNTFDALGRKIDVNIAINTDPDLDVSNTTVAQAFEYDGLSRVTYAHNEGHLGANPSDVNLAYDSLNRVLEDSQVFNMHIRDMTNNAFTSIALSGFTLPHGESFSYTLDALYRPTEMAESGSPFAEWEYFGPSRIAEMGLLSGLICTWMDNARTNSAVQAPSAANPSGVPNPPWVAPPDGQSADRLGYDGAGRMIGKRYLTGGVDGDTGDYNDPTSLVGFTTAFDRASNKLYERALHAENVSSLYEPFDTNQIPQGGYDSLDRLRQYQRGILASTGGFGGNGGGSIALSGMTRQYITLPNTDQVRTYDLDSLGNWRNTVFTPVNTLASETEVRQHNGLNEITRLSDPDADNPLIIPVYDRNGNVQNDGLRLLTWDALNRLVEVDKITGPDTSTEIADYLYDALNRRIHRVVSNGGMTGDVPDGSTDFLYSGWRCMEERDSSEDTTNVQYLWQFYLDELLLMTTYVETGAQPLSAGIYIPLQDMLYRTTALLDGSNNIVETYDTDAYGNTLIFSAADGDGNWWGDEAVQANYSACPFIFTGQRFDAETGLYFCKRREYSPAWGRFLSKDPASQRRTETSPFRYVFNRVTVSVDPDGLGPVLGVDTRPFGMGFTYTSSVTSYGGAGYGQTFEYGFATGNYNTFGMPNFVAKETTSVILLGTNSPGLRCGAGFYFSSTSPRTGFTISDKPVLGVPLGGVGLSQYPDTTKVTPFGAGVTLDAPFPLSEANLRVQRDFSYTQVTPLPDIILGQGYTQWAHDKMYEIPAVTSPLTGQPTVPPVPANTTDPAAAAPSRIQEATRFRTQHEIFKGTPVDPGPDPGSDPQKSLCPLP